MKQPKKKSSSQDEPRAETKEEMLKRELSALQSKQDNTRKDLDLNIERADKAEKNLSHAIEANKEYSAKVQELTTTQGALIKTLELERESKRAILLSIQVSQGQLNVLDLFVPVPTRNQEATDV